MKVPEEKKLYRIAFWLLTLILGATFFVAWGLNFIKFDYDFEKFFPEKDEETIFFKSHRKLFDSDNDFLLVAIERKKGVFNAGFLRQISSLTTAIKAHVPYVTFVGSITEVKEEFLHPFGFRSSRPYLDLINLDLKRDSIRIFNSDELLNSLISKDAKSICIYIRHEDYIPKIKSDLLLKKLNHEISKFQYDGVHIAGRTIGQKLYVEKMMQEMVFFIILSCILVVIFLLFTFRSGWGVLVPLSVILMATLWLIAGMSWFKEPINILLVTLPTIMFVVAMADVIYIVTRFLEGIRSNMSKRDAVILTYKEIAFSAFLTSITTAIGFGSLYFVDVIPVQVFGLVAGIGTIIAYFFTMFLLPILFLLFPIPKYIKVQKEAPFWQVLLRSIFLWLISYRKKVLWGNAILVIICVFGISLIESNNFLMDDLSAKEPLKQDFNYLDKHYGGIRPFDMSIELKDKNLTIWDPEVLNEINKVEVYIEEIYGAEIKNSLCQTLKLLNKASHSGNRNFYSIPTTKRELLKFRKIIRIIGQGKYAKTIIDSSETRLRMNGNFPDIGNQRIQLKNEAFQEFLKQLKYKGKIKYRITGTAHLFDKNIHFISKSLVEGLIFSVLLIALIMGLVYKSVRMMLISMIPNLIPLLVIGAIMGYFGINLKTSTAVIFTIAFGISYDDTIHLLGKFRIELAKGKSKSYALKTAYLERGKAMILSSLVLCCGFSLLIFSNFSGSFYMGVLISITLFIALISDLTLLPILVLMFYKTPKTKKPISLGSIP